MKRAVLFAFVALFVIVNVGSLNAPLLARADDTMEDLQKHVEKLRAQQQSGAKIAPQGAVQPPQAGMVEVQRALQQAPATPSQERKIEVTRTHVRASDGVPFPEPEEVILPPPPPLPPLPTSEMVAYPPQPEYKRPPRCEGDQNIREALGFEYGPSEEVLVSDVIYLPEDLMPVDTIEVLGSKASTHTYGPNSGDGVNIRMYYDAVPCVPYRIRYTNKAKYVDRGNFALKNYDKQPSGRGQYHTWMQQKLFLGK